MFSTNVTGLINMTQAILPIFKKRADGGRGDIINIGSIAGREAYPGGSIYCATKAAIRSFTDALRKELIATRIRIIEIDPGQVETVRLRLCQLYDPSNKGSSIGILRCAVLRRQGQGRCSLCVSIPYMFSRRTKGIWTNTDYLWVLQRLRATYTR